MARPLMAARTIAITMAAVTSLVLTRRAGAQDSAATVTLAGVVRDTSGRLLPGAEVRSGERFTITSDSGTFVLGGLAPDTVEEILAVEVYPRAALVPSVLVGSTSAVSGGAGSNAVMTSQGQRSDCGAIFFWTKPFEPPAR